MVFALHFGGNCFLDLIYAYICKVPEGRQQPFYYNFKRTVRWNGCFQE